MNDAAHRPNEAPLRILQWLLIGLGVAGWLLGLVLVGGESTRDLGASLLFGSTAPFLLGMIVYTARAAGAVVGLGLALCLAAIVLGIVLADQGGIVGSAGSLLFPGALLGLFAWIWWFKIGRPARRERRLQDRGLRLEVEIIGLTRQGIAYRQSAEFPRYGVLIEVDVHRPDMPPYTATIAAMLAESELAALRIGGHLWVRCDPDDRTQLALDRD